MHSLFMRDRASLIEIFVDGSGGNRHFHNMAYWYGRNYIEVHPSSNFADQLFNTVKKEVERLDLTSY